MTRAPREIGGYRLVRPLGEGGMARVYLAVSKRAAGFSKLIVLKVLRQTGEEDPELRRMFLDEAKVAALLSHPNVVQTYEAGEDAGELYLAMEYLEGKALSQLHANDGMKELDRDLHLRIIADGLLGLHYAHDVADIDGRPLNVVHRDVSPQNLFITYEGQSKLVDFGIAKVSGSQKTESGVIKGKVGYIAPELLAGKTIDRRADVFAAGVMIWEALACRRIVPRSEDDLSALARRLDGRDPSIRKHASPGTPPALLDICEKAMAREPDERYPTALALNEALEGYLSTVRIEPRAVARMMQKRYEKHRALEKKATEDAIARNHSVDLDRPERTATLDVDPPTPRSLPPAADASALATQLYTPPQSRPTGPPGPPASNRTGPLSAPPPPSSSRTPPALATDGLAYADTALHSTRASGRRGLSTMTLAILGASIGLALAGGVVAWRTIAHDAAAVAKPVPSARLTVDVQPPQAVVTVDGTVQSAPFVRSVPRGTLVRIEAKADGFVTVMRDVRVEDDTTLSLALAPQPATPASAAPPVVRPTTRPATHARPKATGRAIDDDPYRK